MCSILYFSRKHRKGFAKTNARFFKVRKSGWKWNLGRKNEVMAKERLLHKTCHLSSCTLTHERGAYIGSCCLHSHVKRVIGWLTMSVRVHFIMKDTVCKEGHTAGTCWTLFKFTSVWPQGSRCFQWAVLLLCTHRYPVWVASTGDKNNAIKAKALLAWKLLSLFIENQFLCSFSLGKLIDVFESVSLFLKLGS